MAMDSDITFTLRLCTVKTTTGMANPIEDIANQGKTAQQTVIRMNVEL
ncbi:hypothetical protein OK016_20410 [Vibrio chagasii]|nr:hypothetical protein [Vibrio chagasii]